MDAEEQGGYEMSITLGARVFRSFERPSAELVYLFNGIPSSNIGDIANRLYCTNGELHALNDRPLLGPAFTVKVPAGDNLMIHLALDLAQEGDILVIDGAGETNRSLFGEMMLSYAQKRGLSGIVIDGAVRDLDFCRRAQIPIYAKAVTPQGPYKNGPGEINVPVCCGGQVVFPGDILVGDGDGIVVVRPEQAREIADLARAKMEREIMQRGTTADGSYLKEHEASFLTQAKRKGIVLIDEAYQRHSYQ